LESLQIPSNPVSSYRWLITDIDGTLIADDGSLPARNRDALAHCRELGIPVVLAIDATLVGTVLVVGEIRQLADA
jgi:hypothetical protein